MQLKTFSAKNSAAVLSKIRNEFGSDAVILETREENGTVYMTAALERHIPLSDANDDQGPGPARPDGDAQNRAERDTAQPGRNAQTHPAEKTASPLPPKSSKSPRTTADKAYRSALSFRDEPDILASLPHSRGAPGMDWQEEWSNIKAHLISMMKPALRLDLLAPRQRLALEYLHKQGVEEESLLRLYEGLRDDPAASILKPLSELVTIRPWAEEEWPQRIHCIAGPFGAGKSSVAIRMALSLRRASPGSRVCLVNADATRGNGRLLLRHYCELSDLDYSEASTTLELVAALNKAERGGYERILIDLPGLGRDKRLSALLTDAGLSERCRESESDAAVHLALPPQYSGLEMRNMVERYRSHHAGSLIWTKLDEAVQFGQIVNVGIASGLPVSALSYGPGLGHSYSPAGAAMLWRLLFKQELPAG